MRIRINSLKMTDKGKKKKKDGKGTRIYIIRYRVAKFPKGTKYNKGNF